MDGDSFSRKCTTLVTAVNILVLIDSTCTRTHKFFIQLKISRHNWQTTMDCSMIPTSVTLSISMRSGDSCKEVQIFLKALLYIKLKVSLWTSYEVYLLTFHFNYWFTIWSLYTFSSIRWRKLPSHSFLSPLRVKHWWAKYLALKITFSIALLLASFTSTFSSDKCWKIPLECDHKFNTCLSMKESKLVILREDFNLAVLVWEAIAS